MKMKTARLAVLSVALVAGISAAVLASRSNPTEIAAAPPPPASDRRRARRGKGVERR
jgi:hypothetical protein